MKNRSFRAPAIAMLAVIAATLLLVGLTLFGSVDATPQYLTTLMPHDALGSLATVIPFAAAGKTKFFRVATEGATTDGRVIERSWIEQMAKNFNRAKYGARVWLEHYRGIFPDGPFKAYGDVLAVEARKVEDGKLALFAQLDPSPDLVKMVNDQKQKIYTSIEVNPKFADSNEAYLVGIAVTDSPASLGTEILQFAAQHPSANPLSKRKHDPENLFSEAVEATIEIETDEKSFSDRMKEIMAKTFGRQKAETDDRFADVTTAMESFATEVIEQVSKAMDENKKLASSLANLEKKHTELLAQIDKTPSTDHSQRPPASGGAGAVLTDC